MFIKDAFINSPPPHESSKYENDVVGTCGGGGQLKNTVYICQGGQIG